MENRKKKLLLIVATLGSHFHSSLNSAVNKIMEDNMSESSEDSDSDDELLYTAVLASAHFKNEPNRISGFIERVVRNHNNTEFQQHFRLTRQAFEFLLAKVARNFENREVGRPMIDTEKQLLAVIWLLANQECYRSVSERFDMPKSSLSYAFFRTVNAINKLSSGIIKWPTQTEIAASRQQFELISKLKNCIGAIDGTYVAIKAPKEQAHCYTNRKKFHSVTLQAICNHRMQFLDCSVGYPSSVHDARIFQNSVIYEKAEESTDHMFPFNSVILGDKAYPIKRWCIPPYLDNGNLSDQQKNFNKCHSTARQVVERSFALLFGRWRRLKYVDMNRVDAIPATVMACCCLHNICLLFPDDLRDTYITEGVHAATTNETNNNPIRNVNNATGNALRDLMAAELHN